MHLRVLGINTDVLIAFEARLGNSGPSTKTIPPRRRQERSPREDSPIMPTPTTLTLIIDSSFFASGFALSQFGALYVLSRRRSWGEWSEGSQDRGKLLASELWYK